MKTFLPRQSINFLTQFLSVPGWATKLNEISIAGTILVERLPELDLSWIKSPSEIASMSAAERAAFSAQDKAWCDEMVQIELDDRERQVVRTCLCKFAAQLPVNRYTLALIKEFGLDKE